ncbi:hypothetical protein EDC01DRAFT_668232 [Geopyxis carbonaria]|nr:hypothetical protein EDC01DRAFT_668232 [Geopyxis carbonaria]
MFPHIASLRTRLGTGYHSCCPARLLHSLRVLTLGANPCLHNGQNLGQTRKLYSAHSVLCSTSFSPSSRLYISHRTPTLHPVSTSRHFTELSHPPEKPPNQRKKRRLPQQSQIVPVSSFTMVDTGYSADRKPMEGENPKKGKKARKPRKDRKSQATPSLGVESSGAASKEHGKQDTLDSLPPASASEVLKKHGKNRSSKKRKEATSKKAKTPRKDVGKTPFGDGDNTNTTESIGQLLVRPEESLAVWAPMVVTPQQIRNTRFEYIGVRQSIPRSIVKSQIKIKDLTVVIPRTIARNMNMVESPVEIKALSLLKRPEFSRIAGTMVSRKSLEPPKPRKNSEALATLQNLVDNPEINQYSALEDQQQMNTEEELLFFRYILHPFTALELDDLRVCRVCKRKLGIIRKQNDSNRCRSHKSTRSKKNRDCCSDTGCPIPKGYEPGCQVVIGHSIARANPRWGTYKMTPNPVPGVTKRHAVAIDCEMGGTQDGHPELLQLVAVDYHTGEVLINSLVNPARKITMLHTESSGITKRDLYEAIITGNVLDGWQGARNLLYNYIDADTILIGHALKHDLDALRMIHTKVVDPQVIGKRISKANRVLSLKTLAKDLLQLDIQNDKIRGHHCLEDTLAVRAVVHWIINNPEPFGVWTEKILEEEAVRRARDEVIKEQQIAASRKAKMLQQANDEAKKPPPFIPPPVKKNKNKGTVFFADESEHECNPDYDHEAEMQPKYFEAAEAALPSESEEEEGYYEDQEPYIQAAEDSGVECTEDWDWGESGQQL